MKEKVINETDITELHLNPHPQQKIFVLDTNILLSDPTALYGFGEHFIVLPMTVLDELDNLKDRRDKESVRREARAAIKNLKSIINGHEKDLIRSGMPIRSHDFDTKDSHTSPVAKLAVVYDCRTDEPNSPVSPDNAIIELAKKITDAYPSNEVILITKDVPMQIRGRIYGVRVDDYRNDQIQVADESELFSSIVRIPCELDEIFTNMEIIENRGSANNQETICSYKGFLNAIAQVSEKAPSLMVNSVIVDNQEKAVRIRNITDDQISMKLFSLKCDDITTAKPLNIEQSVAMKSMLDPDNQLSIIYGPAGSGKTVIALAVACQMVEDGICDRIILTRPLIDLDEPVGFLPGTESEKVAPWMGAFYDAFDVLFGAKKATAGGKHSTKQMSPRAENESTLELLFNRYRIEFKSLTFMRGRSLQRSAVIFDEVQNASRHQVKTLATRIGQDSRIFLLGNINQIDNQYNTPQSNGLAYAIDAFKTFEAAFIGALPGGQRSSLATFAEKLK